jgi:serine beta-lactamase-like protein LACTB
MLKFRAGGGFVSTARDVATFGNAFLNSKLFSIATRNLMWTPQTTTKGKNTNWGLGWKIETIDTESNGTEKKRIISHSGGAVGATSQLLIIPEDRVVVAVMSNLQSPSLYETALNIAKIWQSYHPPSSPESTQGNNKTTCL